MEDLFNKLKSEPPVEKTNLKNDSHNTSEENCVEDALKNDKDASSPMRELSPFENAQDDVEMKDLSVSPPPTDNASAKLVKVCLERIKLPSFVEENLSDISPHLTTAGPDLNSSQGVSMSNDQDATEKRFKKLTPTKAEQKSFETPTKLQAKIDSTNIRSNSDLSLWLEDASPKEAGQFKLRKLRVRIKRENLEQLQKRNYEENKKARLAKASQRKTSAKANEKPTKKRKSPNSSLESDCSSSKKRKGAKAGTPTSANKSKKKDNSPTSASKKVYIKINPTPEKRMADKKIKKPVGRPRSSSLDTSSKKKFKKAAYPAYDSFPFGSTKATKFSRSQLYRDFGKRFFQCVVRIERSRHPMMLTFESNARARKLQAKKNKSKNLTVSFNDSVEIIGDDSDSSDSGEEWSHKSASKSLGAAGGNTSALGIMPTRLKKVENGKVVDDIDLDPSLFIVPDDAVKFSTPLEANRKHRIKKSYSPLKGDGSSSGAGKDRYKMANEKLPPCGLRRLTQDDEDEDDEDEYIVPIDIPSRRGSCASSSGGGGGGSTAESDGSPTKPVRSSEEEISIKESSAASNQDEIPTSITRASLSPTPPTAAPVEEAKVESDKQKANEEIKEDTKEDENENEKTVVSKDEENLENVSGETAESFATAKEVDSNRESPVDGEKGLNDVEANNMDIEQLNGHDVAGSDQLFAADALSLAQASDFEDNVTLRAYVDTNLDM